jgi:hypothetical protein
LVDDFLHRRDGDDVISSARSNSGLSWIFCQKCNFTTQLGANYLLADNF